MTKMESSDNKLLDDVVFSALQDVCDFKHDTGRFPELATIQEISVSLKPDILESLRRLYKAGRISHNIDVNKNPLFGIKSL